MEEVKNNHLTFWMIIALITITAIWAGSFFMVTRLWDFPDNPGSVGDMFGAIGALFSGWAFCGMLWAILLQRKSLDYQHHDLMATLDEMKSTRKTHEENVRISKLKIQTDILTTMVNAEVSALSGTSTPHLQGALEAGNQTAIKASLTTNIRQLGTIMVDLSESANTSGPPPA